MFVLAAAAAIAALGLIFAAGAFIAGAGTHSAWIGATASAVLFLPYAATLAFGRYR